VTGFVHREPVRWGDLDAFRHLNNVVFQRYFESAWIAYRQELGVWGNPFSPAFVPLVMAQFAIDYRAPVGFGDVVGIDLAIRDVGRSSFRTEFKMSVGDRLCAEGHGVYVGYDLEAQRSAPLPDEFRQKLEAEQFDAPPGPPEAGSSAGQSTLG
jgi:acyl-CoA thioester hydrolase